jgi:hypothetical protein
MGMAVGERTKWAAATMRPDESYDARRAGGVSS